MDANDEPLMPLFEPRAKAQDERCQETACGFQCVRLKGHTGKHLIETVTETQLVEKK